MWKHKWWLCGFSAVYLLPDLNRLGDTNGLSLPQDETAPVCPSISGHQMAEKIRLGRQDQGDNDTGDILILNIISDNFLLSIETVIISWSYYAFSFFSPSWKESPQKTPTFFILFTWFTRADGHKNQEKGNTFWLINIKPIQKINNYTFKLIFFHVPSCS